MNFDREKCLQRNRIAAKRDAVEAVPISFLKGAVKVGEGSTYAVGTLPLTHEEALMRINALRGEDKEPLTLEQVYIHTFEAANSNFIGDRYAFLSSTTLKNIAKDAQVGYAFMNSHRTGGLSHPSELPFGRTFAGRYERMEDGIERTLVMFYMIRGAYPNGRAQPSTDDLHTGIDGGTIFDVSVGLYGGDYICDVCGENLRNCDHYPGTTYYMSEEQKQAQTDRGIKGGRASYTIDDARCGETSAVYDGAVPGAGFRKASQLLKKRPSKDIAAQVKSAYAPLLSKGDLLQMDELLDAINNGFEALAQKFGKKQPEEKAENAEPPTPSVEELAAAEEQFNTLKAQLASVQETLAAQKAEKEQLEANLATERKAAAEKDRDTLLMQFKREGRLLPAADDHASFLLAHSESDVRDHFAKFVKANGKHVALENADETEEQPTDGAAVNAELAENENADNSVLHNMAMARQKKDGCDYVTALNRVAKDNPSLVKAREDSLTKLG